MVEEWRDIKGYEGIYQVSNLGRVKSLSREYWHGNRWYKQKEKYCGKIYVQAVICQ